MNHGEKSDSSPHDNTIPKIPDDVVERALNATTPECHEGLQYVLIRGLHAIGFKLPASEATELARAAGEVFVAWVERQAQERIFRAEHRELVNAASWHRAAEAAKKGDWSALDLRLAEMTADERHAKVVASMDEQRAIRARSAPEKE